jgi:hypothetical protein
MKDEWTHSIGREKILCMAAMRKTKEILYELDGFICGTDTGQIVFVSMKERTHTMVSPMQISNDSKRSKKTDHPGSYR